MTEYNDEETPDANYRQLWCAVIIQALKDATNLGNTSTDRVAKAQAHAWLTVRTGVTAANFEAVCLAADISPERVRHFYESYVGPPITDHFLSRLRRDLFKESDK